MQHIPWTGKEHAAERRQRCMQLAGGARKKQVMELSHLQVTCLTVAGHLASC